MDPRQRLHLMELLHRLGEGGPHGAVQLAHPRGGRGDRRHHRGDGRRPARGLRRLPRDPPAHDRAAAPVRRAARATTEPRCRADRGRRRVRRSTCGETLRRAGQRLRPVRARPAAAGPAARRSGCSRSRRPTSRWRASSPTWWPDERRRSRCSPLQTLLGRRRALLLLVLPGVLLVALAVVLRFTGRRGFAAGRRRRAARRRSRSPP